MSEFVLPEARLTLLDAHNRSAKFDLNLTVVAHSEMRRGQRGSEAAHHMTLMLEYATDLFDGATIERLLDQYERLLRAAVRESAARISEIVVLDAAARHQLLREWNDGEAEYPRDATIHDLFSEVAAERPDAIALCCGEVQWTYRELEDRAERWARRLRESGIGIEDPVALAAERAPELIAAMLGVLKAGAHYVPLDLASPPERLALQLADLGVPWVVVDRAGAERLPATAARRIDLFAPLPASDVELLPLGDASGLAYVMFTSGSTGAPKGVAIPHRGVVRLVRGSRFCDLGADEVFHQLATVSFDASTLEIWGPLLNGGRLTLAGLRLGAVEDLGTAISTFGVTSLWLTAGLFSEVVDQDLSGLAPLRQLLAGGDALSPDAVRRALAGLPRTRLINGYGPTENTTFSCCATLDGDSVAGSSVTIGRAIENSTAHVLDSTGRPSPIGTVGELCVGGDGLARGYLGRPNLTAERFVPDRSGGFGARLYRTGDLARRLGDGRLEFIGRRDGQVKIRGFRIELGEVERALLALDDVREATVVARADGALGKRLVAYFVADGEGIDAVSLRRSLGSRLPEYMIPAAFVRLDRLPLTANGKIDRRALPDPEGATLSSERVAPRSEIERVLAELFGELLGLPEVGVYDDFFALGGHSLGVTRLLSRIRRELDVEVPVGDFFRDPTVAGVSVAIAAVLMRDFDGDEASDLISGLDFAEPGEPAPPERLGDR